MSDEKIEICGVELPAPYDGFMATEAILVLKGIDSDGDMAMTMRHSDGLMLWDTVGLLSTALDMAKMSGSYMSSDDMDDDGDDDGESA